jgi:HK97 family phage portal protein
MQSYTNSFFKNQARPAGALRHPGRLGPEAAERLRDHWTSLYSGTKNTGRTVVLEEGMAYETLGMSNEDAETLATRKFTLEEIARAYRIPVHVLGHLDRMSYNNVEQLAREFMSLSLMPWLTRIEGRFNATLLTEAERAEGYYFEHVTSGLLRAGTLERYQAYQIALSAGFMTPNEVRQRENLPSLPEGDGLGQGLTTSIEP